MAPGGRKAKKAEEALLKQCLRQLQSAEKHAEEIIEQKNRARDVYLGKTNPYYGRKRDRSNPRDWRSMLFPPIAFEHAELSIASLTSSPPEFDAIARSDKFIEEEKSAEMVVGYYLDRDRFNKKYKTAMRRAVKYGDCPLKIVWNVWRAPVIDPLTGASAMEVVHEGPTIIPLMYEDFLPDPTARSCAEASYVFHKWRATTADLKGRMNDDGTPFYQNLDQLPDRPTSGDDRQKAKNETQEAFDARTTGVNIIHERWTSTGCVTIANKTVVIRNDDDRANPIFEHRKVPFEVVRLIDDDDNIGGVSKMLQMDQLQEAYWAVFNRLIDAINLSVNPPKLVDEELDPNAAQYEIYPGANLPARNGEQTVKVLQDIAQLDKYNPVQLLQMMRDLIERTTGMNSAVAGMSNSNTATEAANNLRQAQSRPSSELSQSDDDWARVVEMVYQLIQQFADRQVIAELTDGKMIPLDPRELRGQMMFKTKLDNERSMRELAMQNTQTLWEMLMPMMQPPGTPGAPYIDPTALVKHIFDTWRAGVNAESVIRIMPEQPMIQQPNPGDASVPTGP